MEKDFFAELRKPTAYVANGNGLAPCGAFCIKGYHKCKADPKIWLKMLFIFFIMLFLVPEADAFMKPRAAVPGLAIAPVHRPPTTSATKLYLDLFGLGPSEIVVVAVVGALLYGPDTIRGQLRDSGVKNSVVTAKGLRLEREERIKDMLDSAEGRRKDRAWQRVNALIEAEDDAMIDKLAAWGDSGRGTRETKEQQPEKDST
jgi:Sec-independent protein translocase protein TatA